MRWLTPEEIQNYGLWLQSGAILIAFVGVLITVRVNRTIAKRRATLDLIMAEQSTYMFVRTRRKFLALRNEGHLVKWAAPAESASESTTTLRSILNRYELIAIGVSEKTLNERVYKRYARSNLVDDWIACKPFIVQRRQTTNNPKLYCEYEALAKRWAKNGENC